MKIDFLPQAAAQELEGDKKSAVISITDPNHPPATLSPNWGRILRVEFHDIESSEADERFIAISWEQARQIVDFVRQAHRAKTPALVVHCWVGVSRSAAVAKIAAAISASRLTQDASGANKSVLRMCWLAWLASAPITAWRRRKMVFET